MLELMTFTNILIGLGALILLITIIKSFIVVGGNNIRILERRWFGKSMPEGRVFAMSGEVGVQVKTLGPGLHFVVPYIFVSEKVNFVIIGDNQIGLVESRTGIPVPKGRIFAEPVESNYFQDGEAFLNNNGQQGPQVDILPPGTYRINTRMFQVTIHSVITIGEGRIGLVESIDGESVPPGRIFAKHVDCNLFQDGRKFFENKGQKGPQIGILPPGNYRINTRLFIVTVVEVTSIGEGKIGLVESIDGNPVPAGRIFAEDAECNSFQDGKMFLDNGGQKGPQIAVLPPGNYRINTKLFNVKPINAIVVGQGQVGVITANDGAQITKGRLLAKVVPGHSNFENGQEFLRNNGEKGPQCQILLPGTYRVNTNLFNVIIKDATVIQASKIGLVTARDGEPLPENEYVAKPIEGHNNYQNITAFLDKGGQRGPQLDVLKPGTYYINPLMFTVDQDDVTTIQRGEVAVVISNVGEEPKASLIVSEAEQQKEERIVTLTDLNESAGETVPAVKPDIFEDRLKAGIERYVVPKGFRGIQSEVVGPGIYYLNRRAFIVYVVNTTNITIDWDEEEATKFDPLKVISRDGFEISVSVKVVIRIRPDQAPYMVAKIGSIENLVDHVIHPMIDSSFRNQASSTSAMNFMQNRHEEQEKAEERARRELEKYHVELVSVLICQIKLPQDLMNTQTQKIIAQQEQTMYVEQQKAQQSRIATEKTKAEADRQGDLVQSAINVEIAQNIKAQVITEAEGSSEAVRLQKKGESDGITFVGKAEGTAILAKGEATAAAYKLQQNAVGAEGLVAIEVTKLLSSSNVKITPDFLVQSGGSEGNGVMELLSAFLVKQITPKNVQGGDAEVK